MRILLQYLALSVLFIPAIYAQNKSGMFIPPMKGTVLLSANFGELRPDHYHSGIDIKTDGVTGKEVFACADGFIYLLLISPTGFGKAVYIRHPSGYSTVYAHLDRFSPEIDTYVKENQYQNKSFAATIYPPAHRFPVRQGDLIGYSGNSGSSGGPHLHFEVRKTSGEKPVNPLQFGFSITDNLRPLINRLVIYPGSESSTVNNKSGKVFLSTTGGNGKFTLSGTSEIRINGPAGFGISARDLVNNTSNKFGISAIELIIDSIPWFTYEIEEFSFSETRYINAHIDYEVLAKNDIEIERAFVLPNDKLSLYKNYMNNGFFDFSDGKRHNVVIRVRDGKSNYSELRFRVLSDTAMKTPLKARRDSVTQVMPYGRVNNFNSAGIKISIPATSLYDTLFFKYSSAGRISTTYSDIHRIHNNHTPLHKPFRLSIRPDTVPVGKESKLMLIQLDNIGRKRGFGGKYADGYVTGEVSSFGDYSVGIDTIAPVINGNTFSSGPDLRGKRELRFRITDDFSGIKSYTGLIDGKWALFEYDPKNNLLFYQFDETRITKNSKHTLSLTVTDNRDNSTTLTRDFTW